MAIGKHVQPRYRRHESRVAEHGERFVYGACTDHEPHRSKTRARNAARSHRNRLRPLPSRDDADHMALRVRQSTLALGS